MGRHENLRDSITQRIYSESLHEQKKGGDALLIGHPAFYLHTGEELPDDIGIRDYAEYDRSLAERLEEAAEQQIDVYVFYPRNKKDFVKDFLGENSEVIDNYIETSSRSGYPIKQAENEYAEIFKGRDSDSVFEVWAEFNGLCAEQLFESAKDIEANYPEEIEIKEGEMFPEYELERSANILYKRGKKPQHVKLMEARNGII